MYKMDTRLNKYSEFLVKAYKKDVVESRESTDNVNPLVSELARWYEKMRNAIEYRDEEVVFRASIERMLKRRMLLGAKAEIISPSLVRELVWARYILEEDEEETTKKVQKIIDFYLRLGKEIVKLQKLKKSEVNALMLQLMSSEIEQQINANHEEEIMANYMFYILKENVITDEEHEEDRDVQVFIAIRKAYAKDDLAFLRFHLYKQYFGNLIEKDSEKIAKDFYEAHASIEKQLKHPTRHKIFTYIKKQIPPFLILEDILVTTQGDIKEKITNEDKFRRMVYAACDLRYKKIVGKVRRAIIRSVIFIVLSKVFFAFSIEGTYESLFYGKVQWGSIALNIIIPTLLMIGIGIFIRTPGKGNTLKIYERIKTLLFTEEPKVGKSIQFLASPESKKSTLNTVFYILWGATFVLSFGAIALLLTKLQFNIVSQMVFIFFLAIVSFLAYRIRLTARVYSVQDKQGVMSPLIDFFFMPFARIGRYLTEGISQINILIFIIDFIIEMPFKVMVEFFEKLFLFLHAKREDLG